MAWRNALTDFHLPYRDLIGPSWTELQRLYPDLTEEVRERKDLYLRNMPMEYRTEVLELYRAFQWFCRVVTHTGGRTTYGDYTFTMQEKHDRWWPYRYAMRRGVRPHDLIIVDDDPAVIANCRGFGIQGVLV